MTSDSGTLTVITANIEHDGGADVNGQPPQRWHEAHALLAEHRPDVLLRQEMTYSHDEGRRLHQAERVLGMRGFLGVRPQGAGRNPTGLFIRPDVLEIHREIEQSRMWRTPPTCVAVSLREVPEVPIAVMSWHLAFNNPPVRATETYEILGIADKNNSGWAFIGAGDCNEAPDPAGERVPPIDWADEKITDRMHMMHRTDSGPNGTRVNRTFSDTTLLTAGLHDPARYAAHTLGQPDALLATAGRHKPHQGGPRRIDRHYVDARLVTAVKMVEVINMDGKSDHDAVKVVYWRTVFADALRRTIAPLPPYHLSPA
ncbi:endonuclease/exonuclease/phosphatase family protein [Streptomyces sp. NPDC059786]|uniref:endonuclease/exonuclease/phosphatase family protein n=1 Tax=Streptomyces sp. NPDC059786 TaxID=3346946 RepID=UPI003646EDF3